MHTEVKPAMQKMPSSKPAYRIKSSMVVVVVLATVGAAADPEGRSSGRVCDVLADLT